MGKLREGRAASGCGSHVHGAAAARAGARSTCLTLATLSTPAPAGATHWGQQLFHVHPPIDCAPGDRIRATLELSRKKENHRLLHIKLTTKVGAIDGPWRAMRGGGEGASSLQGGQPLGDGLKRKLAAGECQRTPCPCSTHRRWRAPRFMRSRTSSPAPTTTTSSKAAACPQAQQPGSWSRGSCPALADMQAHGCSGLAGCPKRGCVGACKCDVRFAVFDWRLGSVNSPGRLVITLDLVRF